jgi:probable O-glycosylation ligase (exosortase A-associated)
MKGLLLTYALTYGGAVASIFNPFIGLLVYVCFAIIRPESLWHWSVGPGNYSRIIAIALLIGWAIHGFGSWRFGRARPVVYCLIGFMIWYATSGFLAYHPEASSRPTEAMLKIVLPFVVGITIIDSQAKLKALAWVIMFSQGYVAYDLNMSYFGGFNRLHNYGFGGMDNNCNAIALVCGAGFAFFLGLGEQKQWRRWLAFVLAGLMAHAIMFSFSRGGMLALIITGVASFVLIRKRPVYYAYLLLAVAVGLRMAGPEVLERFYSAFADQEERDLSAQSRLDMWGACQQLANRHPVFGIGPDNFPIVAPEFGWPLGKQAHSLWFQAAAETGYVGVGLLLTFYLLSMKRLYRMAKDLNRVAPEIADRCRMVIASLIGFMVAAQFVSLPGLEIPYYVNLVGAGFLKLGDELLIDESNEADSDDLADEDEFDETEDERGWNSVA